MYMIREKGREGCCVGALDIWLGVFTCMWSRQGRWDDVPIQDCWSWSMEKLNVLQTKELMMRNVSDSISRFIEDPLP